MQEEKDSGTGWISPRQGWDSTEKEANAEADRNASKRVFRFWLPPEAETEITFVDGENPVSYYEHQVYANGSWRNFFPCLRDFGKKCPLCDSGNEPYLVALFTIIDHTQWESEKSGKHQDEKKLFAARGKVFKVLKKIRAKKGALAGMRINVTRSDKKSPNTGNNFIPMEVAAPEELAKKFPKLVDKETGKIMPFNYKEFVAPKSQEDMAKILTEASEGSESPPPDDEIPF